jgi:uncharacterized membrane protein
MSPETSEWINLGVRWTHVFAGILWIGQTYYFTWLEHWFHDEEQAAGGRAPQVWMLHSGGFYVVGKEKALAAGGPKLHRFRWESLTTWVSGMILLVLVYYMGGAMVDPDVARISTSTAIWIGVGVLVAGWTVYDLLYRSPLGRHERAAGIVSYLLLVALAYGLTHVLSGRAAYIHIGALLGTIMAANVWMRILPAQRRMLAAIQQGTAFDPALAEQAKRRTRHNTFMVVPLVFLMISFHFPTTTYGRSDSWLVLAGLLLVGGVAAKFLRRV